MLDGGCCLGDSPGFGGTGGGPDESPTPPPGGGGCRDFSHSSGGGGTGGGSACCGDCDCSCSEDTTGGSFAKTPRSTVKKSFIEDFFRHDQRHSLFQALAVNSHPNILTIPPDMDGILCHRLRHAVQAVSTFLEQV